MTPGPAGSLEETATACHNPVTIRPRFSYDCLRCPPILFAAIPALLAAWCAGVAQVAAHEAAHRSQDGSCVVIYDAQAPSYWRSDPAACALRLSPASTFKIPHALVALELGIVTPATRQTWDGTRYPTRPSWQATHDLGSAIRNSVLWFFQRTAVKIGAQRMQGYLARFRYGNENTSGPPDAYWVNGRLRISADEQVEFLKRFYYGELPIGSMHIEAVRRMLIHRPGTVQNATGIHFLRGTWDRSAELSAKTGAGNAFEQPGSRVSWLVGQLGLNGNRYIFASNVTGPAIDPLDGAHAAVAAFQARGLLR